MLREVRHTLVYTVGYKITNFDKTSTADILLLAQLSPNRFMIFFLLLTECSRVIWVSDAFGSKPLQQNCR